MHVRMPPVRTDRLPARCDPRTLARGAAFVGAGVPDARSKKGRLPQVSHTNRTDPPRRHTTPINSVPRPRPRTDAATGHEDDLYHHALARWLTEVSRAPDHRDLWTMLRSDSYADLWYDMRTSGERLRARALAWLSTHQRQPGGAHPDPRLDASQVPFSARAIVNTAADLLGTPIWPVPDDSPVAAEADMAHKVTMPAMPRPLAWIVTTPGGRPPAIAVRITAEEQLARTLFDIAQLLGFTAREHDRLADPDAPGGPILLPADTGMRALLHQYAIALLGLPRDCPPDWRCACNAIRARYNAAPPSHEQPTEALSLDELRDSIYHAGNSQRQRADDDDNEEDP